MNNDNVVTLISWELVVRIVKHLSITLGLATPGLALSRIGLYDKGNLEDLIISSGSMNCRTQLGKRGPY